MNTLTYRSFLKTEDGSSWLKDIKRGMYNNTHGEIPLVLIKNLAYLRVNYVHRYQLLSKLKSVGSHLHLKHANASRSESE